MVIPSVLVVILGRLAMGNYTLIKCKAMLVFKDQPKGCKKEELAKKPAKDIKSTETIHTYASLISMALDALRDSKQKIN